MLTDNALDAALKLANLILEEHKQYGTLGQLTPLAESILADDAVRFSATAETRQVNVLQS